MKILEYLKRPVIAAVLAGVGGILLGLIWGWVIQPVEWKNAPPSLLNVGYQEQYLRMAIDSFNVNGDTQLAIQRYQELGSAGPVLLKTIQTNPGKQNPVTIMNFTNLLKPVSVIGSPTPSGTPAPASTSNRLISVGIIVFAILAVAGVGFALYKFLRPKLSRRGDETPPV